MLTHHSVYSLDLLPSSQILHYNSKKESDDQFISFLSLIHGLQKFNVAIFNRFVASKNFKSFSKKCIELIKDMYDVEEIKEVYEIMDMGDSL